MKVKTLLLPLAVGSALAAWTVVVFYFPAYVPNVIGFPAFFLVLPGLFFGYLAGANVHDPNIWVAVAANFFIYAGAAEIAAELWQKHKVRAGRKR